MLGLSGCGIEGQRDANTQLLTAGEVRVYAEKERRAGNPEQAQILEDGNVTPEEYSTAFGLLVDCVTSQGPQVSDPVMDPVSNNRYAFAYDYNGLQPDAAMEVVDRCEASYWSSVSIAFSLSRKEHMDPALVEFAAECLRGLGYAPSGGLTSVRDFVGDLRSEAGDDVVECVHRGVVALFPGLRSVAIGY